VQTFFEVVGKRSLGLDRASVLLSEKKEWERRGARRVGGSQRRRSYGEERKRRAQGQP